MDVTAIKRRVRHLCSETCAGREAGSPEGLAARQFIIGELEAAGVEPTVQPVPGCRGANVIAQIGEALAGARSARAVLVAAHYDHIGRAWPGEAYWGADDNAAAVAVLLGLADRFAGAPPARPLVLAAFDGEEPPHFLTDEMGAVRYCQDPTVPLDRIDIAIVMDLVGHAVGPENAPGEVQRSLFCLGAEKSAGTGAIVDRVAGRARGVALRRLDLDVVPPLSDYEPFRREGVPVLFLTGGRWRHYHEVTDTPDRLDYEKIAATGELLAELIEAFAEAPNDRGRYRPDARDYRRTVGTLGALCRALAPLSPEAAAGAGELDRIARSLDAGAELAPGDWSMTLQILALLERGLA